MSSGDPRKNYLVNVIMDQLLSGKDDTAMREQLCNSAEMDEFLDQSSPKKASTSLKEQTQ